MAVPILIKYLDLDCPPRVVCNCIFSPPGRSSNRSNRNRAWCYEPHRPQGEAV